jgi:ABC-type branched-subunit amino acid transport system substrate-binding protein
VRRRPLQRPLRLLALAALLAPTAACGARWSGDQREEVLARHDGGGGGAVAGGAGGSTTAGATATGATTPVTEGSTGGGDATGGAAAGGGGGGAGEAASGGGGAAATGPAPCEAPTDAPGVDDAEIVVGSISALSGPVPGLGASSAAATRAYVAYRNSLGGVCGRQIVLREADDGTDTGRYRSIVTGLEPAVLGLKGGFTIGDAGAVDVVRDSGLPVVTVPGNEAFGQLPSVFDMNPPFEDLDAVIGKYRYLYDQGARQVAMAYLAVDASRAEAQLQRQLMEAAGLVVVDVQELPISTLSYDSTARRVANSGADYLFFIGDTNGNGSMATAMAGTGHELRFAEYFTFAYGTRFTELAGAAAEGAVSWIRTLPNEEAGGNAEMSTFVAWMDQVAPGDVQDVFAADAWTGARAFFDSLEALPGPITREALIAQLASIGTFDAGGMMGPIRLGIERTDGCVIAMQVQGGVWRRLAPAEGFLC